MCVAGDTPSAINHNVNCYDPACPIHGACRYNCNPHITTACLFDGGHCGGCQKGPEWQGVRGERDLRWDAKGWLVDRPVQCDIENRDSICRLVHFRHWWWFPFFMKGTREYASIFCGHCTAQPYQRSKKRGSSQFHIGDGREHQYSQRYWKYHGRSVEVLWKYGV